MEKNDEVLSLETVAVGSALDSITRGEIDIQISTAHKFPRNLTKFRDNAIEQIKMSEDIAEQCIYRRPVGKEGGVMKYAEGRSIRMAEIISVNYGNMRYGARVIDIQNDKVVVQGMAHDLESNTAVAMDVVESFATKRGIMTERMKVVVAKAALAKARRDAVLAIVPRSLCDPLEEAARNMVGKMGIQKRRKNAIKWLEQKGIDLERVWNVLGIKDESGLKEKELDELTGIKTAITDGEVTINEAFPPIESPMPKDTDGKRKKIGFDKPTPIEESPRYKLYKEIDTMARLLKWDEEKLSKEISQFGVNAKEALDDSQLEGIANVMKKILDKPTGQQNIGG